MLFKALQRLIVGASLLFAPFCLALPAGAVENAAGPVRIVALGDSLTAGYGLSPSQAFPVQLEKALKARGHDVVVENAGVSGDTATQGLARLDWSVPQGTQAVIVALGANDMLRGLPPDVTRTALTNIVTRLKARGIVVLVSGMRAAPNLGASYRQRFDAIYPDLAKEQGVMLHPFLLDGVASRPDLNQPDGLHPTAQGVTRMVEGILPDTEILIEETRRKASAAKPEDAEQKGSTPNSATPPAP